MAKEHVVRIIQKGHKPSKVINGHQLVLKKNPGDVPDKLVFKATGTEAVIFFPDTTLFGQHVYKTDRPGNQTETLEVQNNAQNDFYYYAIWCDSDGDFAEANSHPSIIIED